jgi:hypothetical protein
MSNKEVTNLDTAKICLVGSIIVALLGGMMLCYCPHFFLGAAVLAGVALYRGKGWIRVLASVLIALTLWEGISQTIQSERLNSRLHEIRENQRVQ